MLVPADHVSRSPNDTFYVDADTVLRCHTSAHQASAPGHPSHFRAATVTIPAESGDVLGDV